MSFHQLGLSDELLGAVADSGYSDPTDIQRQAIPLVLMGKDVVGVAQTGTGKTASFVLPMIDILSQGRSRARMPRSLIIAPTRELADQVAQNFEKYGKNSKLSMALLIGGVSFGDQDKALAKGVDVLIATPGRLLDQFERGKILLSGVDILVIDEADRMLDMGFIPDVERICGLLGRNRQTLLFSATMPPPIKKLADKFMSSPKQIEVERQSSTNKNIEQSVQHVGPRGKRGALRKILGSEGMRSAIVFCNRKRDVKTLTDVLKDAGFRAGQIHGDMDQKDRMATMADFKADAINVLVASDVAARGLDVKGVSHVVNYDVPLHAEDYVHRIGRTGRAGATGVAVTLVTDSDTELLENIESLIGQKIAGDAVAAEDAQKDADVPAKAKAPGGSRSRRGGGGKAAAGADAKQDPKESAGKGKAAKDTPPKRAREDERSRRGGRDSAARSADGEPTADDAVADWNGPIPSFLK
ncbi:DEAD/DEAH box helicase [Pacificimonas flava]|uniref:DEAD/DEAH box helicase n=1 Tax=Pacificimonas flava TaxID=1234595 RepID=UPI0005705779|nr:DEAD/DEAH box helicase [Pacificimonas flava]MBB5280702.1 superfamily II DNA/RNA helicase [Pacificimonas flava]